MEKVIIADDSGTARFFIRRCFEVAGLAEAKISEADSGTKVLELLDTDNFDLVITDFNMPGLNGKELLQSMRGLAATQHIPVIVVSSACNTRMERELIALGATAVLKKPPSPALAAEALRPLLGEERI